MRALLIDMDGTLVETESRWWAAERLVMEMHGSTWEEDDQNQAIGGPLFKVVEYMGAKAKVNPEIIFKQIVDEMLKSFSQFKSELLPGWENIIQEAVGGRKDYKVDCLAADFKDWEISWNKKD
ncbi:MAG: hypothetical protein RJA80_266 [Actinomycetota bacterium]